MSRLISRTRLARRAPLRPEEFDFVLSEARAWDTGLDPGSSRSVLADGSVVIFSFSDFFSQGLSDEQIERLVEHNERYPPAPWLYTNGIQLDARLVRTLSERHPDSFRLYLSLFTLDDSIKTRLVPRWRGSSGLLETLGHLRSPILYLTHFGFRRTLGDLEAINARVDRSQGAAVLVSRLHYNRLHPPEIKQLADKGLEDFPLLVRHLVDHRAALANLAIIGLQHPSPAYAWLFRHVLSEKLAAFDPGPHDLVLCSRGALPVLRRLEPLAGVRVHGVADLLGGSTDFATSVTTPALVRCLGELIARGNRAARVIVPSSMWPWDAHCLGGGTVNDLRRAFPQLEIAVVDIPFDVVSSSLRPEQCWEFYEAGGLSW